MTWAAVQAKPSHAPAFGHDSAYGSGADDALFSGAEVRYIF